MRFLCCLLTVNSSNAACLPTPPSLPAYHHAIQLLSCFELCPSWHMFRKGHMQQLKKIMTIQKISSHESYIQKNTSQLSQLQTKIEIAADEKTVVDFEDGETVIWTTRYCCSSTSVISFSESECRRYVVDRGPSCPSTSSWSKPTADVGYCFSLPKVIFVSSYQLLEYCHQCWRQFQLHLINFSWKLSCSVSCFCCMQLASIVVVVVYYFAHNCCTISLSLTVIYPYW